MATDILHLNLNYSDGLTPYSAAEIKMAHGAIDNQGLAWLRSYAVRYPDGVVFRIPDETSWEVSNSGVISPGAGFAAHPTRVGAFLQTVNDVTVDEDTPGFEASATSLYLFAVIDTVSDNNSFQTRLPVFVLSDSATYSGGILIASNVHTDSDSVTSATDARHIILPFGTGGSAWFTGTTAPDNANGEDDDFYLRSTGDVYQKTDGVWATIGINLKGAQGVQGSAGPQGAAGPQGSAGPQGAGGGSGPQGAAGPQGTTGGSGPQGAAGPQGYQGTVGPQGPSGGPQGDAGPQGPQGSAGPQGPQGSSGPQGAGGPQGTQGATGSGSQGSAGPQGPQGAAGSGATGLIEALTFDIYEGGSAISTGIKGDIMVPYGCVIKSVTVLGDQTGSVVIDLWKDSYTNFPPDNTDTITDVVKPAITAGIKYQNNNTETDWSPSTVNAGDIIRVNIDSCSTFTRILMVLKVART